ncbi:hypothetical protein N0V90_003670 [Kalmusia sp. IMI 367209]|nr:hypothetical protein N0V90_003670 [Kalmusia sp. IMI 367209]
MSSAERASGIALDPLFMPATDMNRDTAYLDSKQTELCPDYSLKDVALTNPAHSRFSAAFRVACGVDFYGGDLPDGRLATEGGLTACFVACTQTTGCKGVVFAALSPGSHTGDCYLKDRVHDPSYNPGLVGVVRRADLQPNIALITEEPFFRDHQE